MRIVSSAKLSEKHQIRLREGYPDHQFFFYSQPEEVEPEVQKEAEVLITYGKVSSSFIEQMPKLKWIQVLSAGIERLPLGEIKERNILVTNARGIHGIQMAEYTLGMILNLVRRNYILYENQKQKKWDNRIRLDEAYGKTLGILGLGAIGTEIAKRAKAFGMKVIALRRNRGEVPQFVDELYSLEERMKLFEESDFLVVLLPVTPETIHFVGEEELAAMKNSAYLINIARGAIVDEQALIKSLQENRIAGAVLDVFVEEPLPEDHVLWTLPNVIITPHNAGSSPKYIERALEIFRHNLDAYPNKEKMRNVIDLDRGY